MPTNDNYSAIVKSALSTTPAPTQDHSSIIKQALGSSGGSRSGGWTQFDGDTDMGPDGTRHRYDGIDTPEMGRKRVREEQILAGPARDRAAELRESGYDQAVKSGDGKYDRELTDYRNAEGESIGEVLIREGYAKPWRGSDGLRFRDAYLDLLQSYDRGESIPALERAHPELYAIQEQMSHDTLDVLSDAWNRGIHQTLGGGATGFQFIGKKLGWDKLEGWSEEVAFQQFQEAAQYPMRVENISEVDDLADAWLYLVETIGGEAFNTLGDAALMATGAGVGVVAARRVTYAGMMKSLLAKGPMTPQMLKRTATLQRAKAANIGAQTALHTSLGIQMTGQTYGQMQAQGIDDPDFWSVAGPAAINTVLQGAAMNQLMGLVRVDRAAAMGSATELLKSVGRDMGVTVTAQGAVEGAVQLINELAVKGEKPEYELNTLAIWDAAARGAVFGGAASTASAVGQGAVYGLNAGRQAMPQTPNETDGGLDGGAPTITDPGAGGLREEEDVGVGSSRRTDFTMQEESAVQQEAADLLNPNVRRDTMVIHPDNLASVEGTLQGSDVRRYTATDGMITLTRDPNVQSALETNAERQSALGYTDNIDNLRDDAVIVQAFTPEGTKRWNEAVNPENVEQAKQKIQERFPDSEVKVVTPEAEQNERVDLKTDKRSMKVNTKPETKAEPEVKPYPEVPKSKKEAKADLVDEAAKHGITNADSPGFKQNIAQVRNDLVDLLHKTTGRTKDDVRGFVHRLTDAESMRLADKEGIKIQRDLGDKETAIQAGLTKLRGKLDGDGYAGHDYSQLFEALNLDAPKEVLSKRRGDNNTAYNRRVAQFLQQNESQINKAIGEATPKQLADIETALGFYVTRKGRSKARTELTKQTRAGIKAAIAERKSPEQLKAEARAIAQKRVAEAKKNAKTPEQKKLADKSEAAAKEREAKAEAKKQTTAQQKASLEAQLAAKIEATDREGRQKEAEFNSMLRLIVNPDTGKIFTYRELIDIAFMYAKSRAPKKAKDHEIMAIAQGQLSTRLKMMRRDTLPTMVNYSDIFLMEAPRHIESAFKRFVSNNEYKDNVQGDLLRLRDMRSLFTYIAKERNVSPQVATSWLQNTNSATRLWALVEMLTPPAWIKSDGVADLQSEVHRLQVALRIKEAMIFNPDETAQFVIPMVNAVFDTMILRKQDPAGQSRVSQFHGVDATKELRTKVNNSDAELRGFLYDEKPLTDVPNVMFKPQKVDKRGDSLIYNVTLTEGDIYATETIDYWDADPNFTPPLTAHHGANVVEQKYDAEESADRTLWFNLKQATLHVAKSISASFKKRLNIPNSMERQTVYNSKNLLAVLAGVRRNKTSAFAGKDMVAIDFETYHDDEVSLKNMTVEDYLAHPSVADGLITMSYARRVNGVMEKGVLTGKEAISAYLDGLRTQDVTVSMHNASFDARILSDMFGFEKPMIDTMHLHMMLNPTIDPKFQSAPPGEGVKPYSWNSLANVSRLVSLNEADHKQTDGDVLEKIKGMQELTPELEAQLIAYNEQDAVAGLRVTEELGYFVDSDLLAQADSYLKTALGDINAYRDLTLDAAVFGDKRSGALRDRTDRVARFNEARNEAYANLIPVTRTVRQFDADGNERVLSEFVVMIDTVELASYGKGGRPKTLVEAEARLYENLSAMMEGGFIKDTEEGGDIRYDFTSPLLHDNLVIMFDVDSGLPRSLGEARDARRILEFESVRENEGKENKFSDAISFESLEDTLDNIDSKLAEIYWSDNQRIERAGDMDKAGTENLNTVLSELLNDDSDYADRNQNNYTKLESNGREIAQKIEVEEGKNLYDLIQDRYSVLRELSQRDRAQRKTAQVDNIDTFSEIAGESEGKRNNSWVEDGNSRAAQVNGDLKDLYKALDRANTSEARAEVEESINSLLVEQRELNLMANREVVPTIPKELRQEYKEIAEHMGLTGELEGDTPQEKLVVIEKRIRDMLNAIINANATQDVTELRLELNALILRKKEIYTVPEKKAISTPRHEAHVVAAKNEQAKIKSARSKFFKKNKVHAFYSNTNDSQIKQAVAGLLQGARTLMRMETPLVVMDYSSLKDIPKNLKGILSDSDLNRLVAETGKIRDRGEYGYYNAGAFTVIVVPNNVRNRSLKGNAQHLLKVAHEFGHMAYDSAYRSLYDVSATPNDRGQYPLTAEGKKLFEAYELQIQTTQTRKNYTFKEWFSDQTAMAVMNLSGTVNDSRIKMMQEIASAPDREAGEGAKTRVGKSKVDRSKADAKVNKRVDEIHGKIVELREKQAKTKDEKTKAEIRQELVALFKERASLEKAFLASEIKVRENEDAKLQRLDAKVAKAKAAVDKLRDPRQAKLTRELREAQIKIDELNLEVGKLEKSAERSKSINKPDVAKATLAKARIIQKQIAELNAEIKGNQAELAKITSRPAKAEATSAYDAALKERKEHAAQIKARRVATNPDADTNTTVENVDKVTLRSVYAIPRFFADLAQRFNRLFNFVARRMRMPEVTPQFDQFMGAIISGEVNMSVANNAFAGAEYFNGKAELNKLTASIKTGKLSGLASIFRTAVGDIERYNPLLGKMLFQRPGSDSHGKQSYETLRLSMERQVNALVSKTLGEIDPSFKASASMAIGKESAKLKQAFANYRENKKTLDANLLDNMFKDIDALAKKHMPEYERSGRIPFAFDHRVVELKRAELLAMIKASPMFKGLTDQDINDRIEAMLDGGGNAEFAIGPGMPVGMHEFTTAIVKALGENTLIKEGFLLDKPTHILTHFISGVSKRAAWEGTFGAYVDGSDLPITQRNGNDKRWSPNALYLQQEQLVREQFGEAAANEVRQVVRGIIGHRVREMNPVARQVQESWINVSSWALLPFAGVASIPEVATPMIRALDSTMTMRDIIASLGDLRWARQFAKDIGLILPTIYNQMSRMTDQGYEAVGTRAITGWFFVANGQVFMSNLAKTVGVAIGRQYLIRAMQNGDAAGLARLNISAEQVQAWIDNGMGSFQEGEGTVRENNEAVMRAIHQFVDEGTLDPSRAQGPAWMNNPYLATIAYLKRFLWAFGDVVIGGIYRGAARMIREGKAKGYSNAGVLATTLLPYMAMGAVLVALGAVSGETREWLKGSDRLDQLSASEYWHEAFARAGGYGVFEVFRTVDRAMEFNRSIFGALVAPVGVLEQTISFNESDPMTEQFWEKLKFLLPFL